MIRQVNVGLKLSQLLIYVTFRAFYLTTNQMQGKHVLICVIFFSRFYKRRT